MEINAIYPVKYNLPVMEYQKTTVRVVHDQQTVTVTTYDKQGALIETVVRSHNIAEV
jgi:YD repeat-containing protein